jgi:regulator of ribonuclease activity B
MVGDIVASQLDAHLRRNIALVEKIQALGGDLGETHIIDFFFYAPAEPDADGLAGDLRTIGFTSVQVAKRDETWAITAEKKTTVSVITAEPFVRQVVHLASKYLAQFDGWGTAV